ncbi:MAG: glycosyltransferase [Planctomycetota bacterium]
MTAKPAESADMPLGEILSGVRVGIAGSLGHARGRDRVSARIAEHLLTAGAEVIGLRDGNLGEEALPPLASVDEFPVSEEGLRRWLARRRPDALIFNEQRQWPAGQWKGEDLVRAAAAAGVPCFGFLVWERVFPDRLGQLSPYRAVLAAHSVFDEMLSAAGIPTIPFRWGWRAPPPKPALPPDAAIEALHVSGTGGAFRRKGTDRAAEAFLALAGEPGFRCRITTQRPFRSAYCKRLRGAGIVVEEGNLPRTRIEALTRAARVAVLPSRWEGLGLGIVEALAAGTPVVTTAGPPMSEWVRDGREGLLVPATRERQAEIAVATLETTPEDLAASLRRLEDRELLAHLEEGARQGGPGRVDPTAAARRLAVGIRRCL